LEKLALSVLTDVAGISVKACLKVNLFSSAKAEKQKKEKKETMDP
jgi:hypothetical protein